MEWFSALIPSYPDIQAKAHADLVVGRDRLPDIDDQKDLPYIRAIIKVHAYTCADVLGMCNNDPVQEVERFRNPFWLGTPHVNMEDFTYQGQFIPKNTVVICNTVRTFLI